MIAYIGVPAHGHTNPALSVLAEMKARGHRVIMFNAQYFATKARAAGLDFVSSPPSSPTRMSSAMP